MADDINLEKIDSLYSIASARREKGDRKGHERGNPDDKDKSTDDTGHEPVGTHYHELDREVAYANSMLEQEESPYRFDLHKEDDTVYIDIVVLDDNGNIIETLRKNVTHREFSQYRVAILEGGGLLLDNLG